VDAGKIHAGRVGSQGLHAFSFFSPKRLSLHKYMKLST
jgi:hypothetical protein